MSRKRPKKTTATWGDVRRAALDDAARRVLLDPEASDELLTEARAHLASAAEITAAELAKLSPSALAAIRSAMTGTPVVRHDLAAVAPTAPSECQVDEPADQDTGTVPVVAKQVPIAPESKQPVPYRAPGPVSRPAKDPGSKYLDDGPTIRARAKDDVRKLR